MFFHVSFIVAKISDICVLKNKNPHLGVLKSEKVYNFRLKFAKNFFKFLTFDRNRWFFAYFLVFRGGGGEDGILGQAFLT
jgi:hypothetical protein